MTRKLSFKEIGLLPDNGVPSSQIREVLRLYLHLRTPRQVAYTLDAQVFTPERAAHVESVINLFLDIAERNGLNSEGFLKVVEKHNRAYAIELENKQPNSLDEKSLKEKAGWSREMQAFRKDGILGLAKKLGQSGKDGQSPQR